MFYEWSQDQVHEIDFVMVDGTGNEVAGLGAGFTLELRKPGGAFVASAGTKAEISDGWYRYTNVASESDTVGPVPIKVTGAGAIQQNLVAVVEDLRVNAIPYTYTVTNSATAAPIEGALVWVTTDLAGDNIIWTGTTDALGVARDTRNNLPRLDAGTYYFWKQLGAFEDDDNPDTETVS